MRREGLVREGSKANEPIVAEIKRKNKDRHTGPCTYYVNLGGKGGKCQRSIMGGGSVGVGGGEGSANEYVIF